MKQTLKLWMLAAILSCGAMSALAQKIQVVDKDDNAVPYASVMTTDATLIGVTGMDGTLADVKGAKNVVVSHVAFKPQTFTISGDNLRVTLDDADIQLPEITVMKKNYTYLQVYYRMVIFAKDGIIYYRAGINDNFLNETDGKQEASKQHTSMAKRAKWAYNVLFGDQLDEKAAIHTKPLEQSMTENGKTQGLRFVDEGDGRQSIVDNYGTIGNVIDRNGQRRFTIDGFTRKNHRLQAEGKTKELEKRQKQWADAENRVNSSFRTYCIDEEGHYRPEDFLMEQNMMSWDSEKDGHVLLVMDFFATDRGYFTKEEVKQMKKEKKANKTKLTFENLQEFERQHGIPALAPEVIAKLKELTDKE